MARAARILKDPRPTPAARHLVVPSDLLDPIVTVDPSGQIQAASDSVRRLFGWEPTELVGRSVLSLLGAAQTVSMAKLLDRPKKPVKGSAITRPRRLLAINKDGVLFPIELSVSAADIPGQSFPVFILLIRQGRKGEAAKVSAVKEQARLLALVTEQSKAITAAHVRMRQGDRMAAIGTLAAGLGHDMNNVLLPMRAHLNALAAKHCTPAGKDHLDAVRRSVSYLQQLCDGLHHLTQNPDTDDGRPETDIATWWKDVGGLLSDAVPDDVTVDVHLDSALPKVAIAPHRLTQAVLNLIVNAGEALTDPASTNGQTAVQSNGHANGQRSGKHRSGKHRSPALLKLVRVWADYDDSAQKVRLGITDNGPGMSPEVRRRAFELFFTTKVRRLGSGLGMALVHRLITGAGGSVKVESKTAPRPTRAPVLKPPKNDQAKPGAAARNTLAAATGTSVILSLPVVVRTFRPPQPASGSSHSFRRQAVISMADGRIAAMVRLTLETTVSNETPSRQGRHAAAELDVVMAKHPGEAQLWVTDPTPAALATARRWCAEDSERRIVAAGTPPPRDAAAWRELGATVIDDISHLTEIRLGLLRALAN